ncbi:glycosyltransferase, partial [Candidatus Dependentiae bacterium]|nr:glycosyltransferase [Candidatus Dependentiae bacterium]
ENIYSKTIKQLKKCNYFLINFYPDNPFVFWNGNSNKEVLNSLPYYDYFLSWSRLLIPILNTAGAKNVYYFPFAYDKDIYEKDIKLSKLDFNKYKSDICFIGTWEKEREIWLENLLEKMSNLNLVIYGNLWKENLNKNSILRKFLKSNAVYKDELLKIFKTSKIVLNFIRKQNYSSHNMRTFEVPATESFLLTQRTQEQAEFLFKEGENIECFSSVKELVQKIKFYLKNEELRKAIAKKGKQRAKEFELRIVLKKFMEYIHKN